MHVMAIIIPYDKIQKLTQKDTKSLFKIFFIFITIKRSSKIPDISTY